MTKVLVVEDDVDIRALVEVRLRRQGHRVVCVGSGEEALQLLAERGAPDVVVLDVQLPGMSGLELLGALRQDDGLGHVPAVFLSGRVQEHDVAAGRALGATYLTKPVILSALVAAVDDAVRAHAVAVGSW